MPTPDCYREDKFTDADLDLADRDTPSLSDLASESDPPDYSPDEDDEYVVEPSHLIHQSLIYVSTPDGSIPAHLLD